MFWKREDQGNGNETGLKEGGGIEMSIYSAFHNTRCSLSSLFVFYLPLSASDTNNVASKIFLPPSCCDLMCLIVASSTMKPPPEAIKHAVNKSWLDAAIENAFSPNVLTQLKPTDCARTMLFTTWMFQQQMNSCVFKKSNVKVSILLVLGLDFWNAVIYRERQLLIRGKWNYKNKR